MFKFVEIYWHFMIPLNCVNEHISVLSFFLLPSTVSVRLEFCIICVHRWKSWPKGERMKRNTPIHLRNKCDLFRSSFAYFGPGKKTLSNSCDFVFIDPFSMLCRTRIQFTNNVAKWSRIKKVLKLRLEHTRGQQHQHQQQWQRNDIIISASFRYQMIRK